MKRTLICLLCLLLTASFAACGGAQDPPAAPPAESILPTAESAPASSPAPSPEPTPEPASEPTPEPAPDCAAWLARTGGEALWGRGEPDTALDRDGLGYVDLDAGDCWLGTGTGWVSCGNLKEAGLCLVRFAGPEGELSRIQVTEKGALLPEPAAETLSGRHFEGWFTEEGGPWRFAESAVTGDMSLHALYTDTAPLALPKLKAEDIRASYCHPEGPVAVLVIYCGCTDAPAPDRAALEDLFCGAYDRENELRSAASYFRWNSGGKVTLDCHFCYLDTGLSSAELYETVQRAGRRYEIDEYYGSLFRKALAAEGLDPKELDKDGDGYVDCVVFLSGEDPRKTVGDGEEYYVFGGGSMGTLTADPDPRHPVMIQFIHMSAATLSQPLYPSIQGSGARVLIHELGHAFGLMDYYDFAPDAEGNTIDVLGMFDMQSCDLGDWNPYSRFLCGWVEPWLIEKGTRQITLKIDPDHPLLIPGSKGWNGTPFDEYILVDVLAPMGANGYDWRSLMDERLVLQTNPKRLGGVRVYHVDGRLLRTPLDRSEVCYSPAYTYEEILAASQAPMTRLDYAFSCSNGQQPKLEGDSPYYHMIDLIPSDGSSKFRICHPLDWAVMTPACVKDLFGPGEEFSMARCGEAFPNAPRLNNGGTLDYSLRVEAYDPESCSAIVTVTRVG